MLKRIRIGVAALFFVGITLLFIGIGEQWWGWMAKLQFLPSCLAANFVVIAAVLVLTLLLGRIYCSVICPLGVLQDIVFAIRSRIGKKNRSRALKLSYKKEKKMLRYGIMLAFIACIIADIQVIVALIAPYSAYGRIVSSIVHPHGWIVPTVAAVTFLIVVILAWMGGRAWCNEICPVGSFLSLFSRISLFGIKIDESKCVNCHLCERNCKGACIDVATHTVDHSRCVDCFDCLGNCKKGGISFGRIHKKSVKADGAAADEGRRAFMAATVMLGTSALLNAQNKLDGGLAPVVDKQCPERENPLTPPGSKSAKDFYGRCTACQLCVSNCPNKVLRPSTDLEHVMQPQMGFDKGFCRPECTTCSTVCPVGAIRKIEPEEKTAIHIGKAVVNLDACLSANGENCRSCGSHCPAGAISYVDRDPKDAKAGRMPVVREDLCIGCGKCEYLCPVRPISAIHVEGYPDHVVS